MATKTAEVESLRAAVDRLCRRDGRAKYWLAEQVGWSQEHLSRVINGRVPLTRVAAEKLAEIFGEPVATFLPEPDSS